MKLNLETRYSIFDEVEYKKVDTFAIIEGDKPKEEIKQSSITSIDIQVGHFGDIYVKYGMKNEDVVCSDCIIREL